MGCCGSFCRQRNSQPKIPSSEFPVADSYDTFRPLSREFAAHGINFPPQGRRCMSNWSDRVTLPILRGPLAGKSWMLASRINFFFGTYEPEQTQAFQEIVRPGNVVYDIGAHFGYYTLLASGLAGPTGRV